MTNVEKTAIVVDALNSLDIPYMLTGSLASNLYGIVRATKDADFVVQVDAAGITRIAAQLTEHFTLDPQASFETVTMTYRYVLLSRDGDLKVELFLLSDEPYDQERFRRRTRGIFSGRPAWVPTAEDVILAKLKWKRRKDLDDVRHVLSVQAGKLDEAYLDDWSERRSSRALLDELRREASQC